MARRSQSAGLLLVTQIPLVGGMAIWAERARQDPLLAIVLALLYEAGLLAIAFVKKVWAGVETTAVKAVTDRIIARASSVSPGFRRRYHRQVVRDHNLLNVRSLALIESYRLRLDNVFVDLKVAMSINPQRPNIDPLKKSGSEVQHSIWSVLRSERTIQDDLRAMAILGAPGCGKTTLLQHIALTLARHRHGRYGIRSYIPVLIFLREHVDFVLEAAPTLGAVLQRHFENTGRYPNLRPPPDWFETQLQKGNCLVLLDGFDEVGDLARRSALAQWLESQIRGYSRCVFILTSRPQGFRETPLPVDVLEMQPFTGEQVRRFVENWYLANEIMRSGGKRDAPAEARAAEGARGLLLQLHALPALQALTANPLLLTMIAMVHSYQGELPKSRAELYSQICEVMLGRWRQGRGVKELLSAAQKAVVLRPLAAHMMQERKNTIGTGEALRVIATALPRLQAGGGQRADEAFLQDIEASSGLLMEREPGKWGFAHLTFQEYLTAAHWLEHIAAAPAFGHIVSDGWWHETLRLYAAKTDATHLVGACLASDTIASLTLAADCLAEARELDVAVREATETRLFADLGSLNPIRRRLAVEVQISRRLKALDPLDDCRGIDANCLSQAEYQLFLDEMEAEGQSYRPDHWSAGPPSAPQDPVSGVRASDAVAFCAWLTRRRGGHLRYRIPTSEEAETRPAKRSDVAAWCCDGDELGIRGLDAASEEGIWQQLNRLLPGSKFALPSSLGMAKLQLEERMLAQVRCTDCSRMPLSQRRDFSLASALSLQLDQMLFHVFDRNLHRAGDRELASELARDLMDAETASSNLATDLAVLNSKFRELAQSLAIDLVGDRIYNRTIAADADRTALLEKIYTRARTAVDGTCVGSERIRELARALALGRLTAIKEARSKSQELDQNLEMIRKNLRSTSIDGYLAIARATALEANSALEHALNRHRREQIQVVVTALEGNALQQAVHAAMILERNPDATISRIASLTSLLLEAAQAATPAEKQETRWRFLALVLESLHEGFKDAEGYPSKAVAELYWWLRLVPARRAGQIPAWEAIRVVQEYVIPADTPTAT